jgi:hypothetical protein
MKVLQKSSMNRLWAGELHSFAVPWKGPVGGYYGFSAINNCFLLANYNELLRCERCSFSRMDLDSDYYSSRCKDINGL